MHMPRATPAWGNRVTPRYFTTLGLQPMAFAEMKAPEYFPRQRDRMKTTPISTSMGSWKTASSSSAPLTTKNTASRGWDHRSARPIRSSARGLRLQNTVPSIMQTRSGENPMVSGPAGNSREESPTVRMTKAMVREVLFVLEWNRVSSQVRVMPASVPRSPEARILTRGPAAMERRSMFPRIMALAMPKETAKTIRPTASSRATMGSRRSVSLPFALYCRTTIRVAAGAVAVAMAPRVMAAGRDRRSGFQKCSPAMARSTSTAAVRAWTMPMTKACLPVFCSDSRRNSVPMEKAMKPMATSESSDSDSTFS